MNVSRLPGYSRLEEELEADDLLRNAAVEVSNFFLQNMVNILSNMVKMWSNMVKIWSNMVKVW